MIESLKAYAKINIGLRILERRTDGYHNIETIFHKVDLYDEISLSERSSISVSSSSELAPGNESNICYKAARLLQVYLEEDQGVHISITKTIPVGAGLGGGSSDAATVLRHLPELWNRSIDEIALRRLALQLGADVPFFLGNQSARGTNLGDKLDFFRLDVPYFILLCHPNIHVATEWAYKQVTPEKKERRAPLTKTLLENLMHSEEFEKDVHNDFEQIVFSRFPKILRVKEKMLEDGSVYASMSGSGSTVFGFFQDENGASNTASALKSQGYQTFLTRPRFHPEEETST